MDTQGARGRFPIAAEWQSLEPLAPDRPSRPNIATALGPYCENNTELFHCPSDLFISSKDADGNTIIDDTKSHFIVEGTSYEYFADTYSLLKYTVPPAGSPSTAKGTYVGKTRQQVLVQRAGPNSNDEAPSGTIFLFSDYEAGVHGTAGEDGGRCFAYLDGHADAVFTSD
jgi:hypothetical protein